MDFYCLHSWLRESTYDLKSLSLIPPVSNSLYTISHRFVSIVITGESSYVAQFWRNDESQHGTFLFKNQQCHKGRAIWRDLDLKNEFQLKLISTPIHQHPLIYPLPPSLQAIAWPSGSQQPPQISETPLCLAVRVEKARELIMALVSGGAHLDFRARDTMAPLHKAAVHNNYDAIRVSFWFRFRFQFQFRFRFCFFLF